MNRSKRRKTNNRLQQLRDKLLGIELSFTQELWTSTLCYEVIFKQHNARWISQCKLINRSATDPTQRADPMYFYNTYRPRQQEVPTTDFVQFNIFHQFPTTALGAGWRQCAAGSVPSGGQAAGQGGILTTTPCS